MAKRLREFRLSASVCELIDFDFEPHLMSLGGSHFSNLNKIVLQGKLFSCINILMLPWCRHISILFIYENHFVFNDLGLREIDISRKTMTDFVQLLERKYQRTFNDMKCEDGTNSINSMSSSHEANHQKDISNQKLR